MGVLLWQKLSSLFPPLKSRMPSQKKSPITCSMTVDDTCPFPSMAQNCGIWRLSRKMVKKHAVFWQLPWCIPRASQKATRRKQKSKNSRYCPCHLNKNTKNRSCRKSSQSLWIHCTRMVHQIFSRRVKRTRWTHYPSLWTFYFSIYRQPCWFTIDYIIMGFWEWFPK